MLNLGDARPCAERANMLKAQADLRMVGSLRYLLQVLESEDNRATGVSTKLDDITSLISEGKRLNAAAYALHSQLHDAMKANNGNEAVRLAGAFQPTQLCDCLLSVSPQGKARQDAFVQQLFDDVMHGEHNTAYKSHYDAEPPVSDHWKRSFAAHSQVLDILTEHDPETAEEIRNYVSDILIIASDAINAGTSFRVHGLILLRQLDDQRAWTTYLENIVHEAAHLHLFMVWTQDSVFESGANDLGKSPLRKGERPMSGIFHAMFVLARTIRTVQLFSRIPELAGEVANMSTGYNNRKNSAPFETKFREARATLKDAHLTEVGQRLMDSCAEMVAA